MTMRRVFAFLLALAVIAAPVAQAVGSAAPSHAVGAGAGCEKQPCSCDTAGACDDTAACAASCFANAGIVPLTTHAAPLPRAASRRRRGRGRMALAAPPPLPPPQS
jgi:hypothetical protein